MGILKNIWWLLFFAIPFIFIWFIIAPAFMPIIDTLFETSVNTTVALSTNASANMTATEKAIGYSLPTVFLLFPIAFIVFIIVLKFRGNDKDGYQ